MKLIKLSKIIVPENRQRKTFDAGRIKELAESIKNVGLLHPIVVLPSSSEEFRLVAGERRLRALETIKEEHFCNGQLVSEGFALCSFTAELDDFERREAELDENIKRVDLTWQERAGAINALAALRREQKPETTKIEIAQELAAATDVSVEAARAEIARAEVVGRMIDDPKVAAARTFREAYTIASKLIESEFTAALAAATGDVSSEHSCITGDCISAMSVLPPASFDCIITDPPYGMGADSFGDAGPSHAYSDTKDDAMRIAKQIILHGLVLCKPAAHLYVFCDIDNFHELRDFCAANAWKPWRTPLVWDKGGALGHNPIPDQAIRRSYETILYAYRDNRPGIVFSSDVIRGIPTVSAPTHPAEKPALLYKHLLSRSCRPGDSVLDPCCGTGAVFEAANMLHLRATGIELDPTYTNMAKGRFTKGTASDTSSVNSPDSVSSL